MPKIWAQGMRRLTEGVYSDGRGGVHIDCVEMLQSENFPVTPENVDSTEKSILEIAGALLSAMRGVREILEEDMSHAYKQ